MGGGQFCAGHKLQTCASREAQTQKINDQDVELIVNNTYDELGQLVSKKVGGTSTTLSTQGTLSGAEGLQTVDYTYNIRGWLKTINDPNNLGDDLFAFGINYNTTTENLYASKLYNGNISETIWRTANDNTKRAYGYRYDALNRFVAATDNDNKYVVSSITYDKMGNIESLARNGWQNSTNYGNVDVLAYDYDSGNKLQKVTDTGNKDYGFKDGTNTNDDFEYDENGNMIVDRNKGITAIAYNHLNLPETVSISNSEGTGTIAYIYDATGAKQKKIVTEGSSITNTEYLGSFVYKNGSLEFFNQTEGIVEKEADGYKYVYQFKDHLDNIRLSYSDKDNDGNITQNEIVQEKNYYPFGLTQKGYNEVLRGRNHAYGFTNKEEQDEIGLGWVDITARNYDPALGRWMNLDPFAEQMRRHSPYNYGFDNPIYFLDPDGMKPLGSQKCCGDENPTQDFNPLPGPVKKLEPFTPSQETLDLIEEGKQLLSDVFDFNASAKGKIGVGGNVNIGPTKVGAEANAISVSGSVNEDGAKGKIRVVDVKGSIQIGPKDSDSNITAFGTFNVADVNVSIDKDLNVDGSIENGGFDGDIVTGKGTDLKLTTKDFLTFGLGGKIGPVRVSGSVDLYNLGKGLSKTIQSGVSLLNDYVNNVLD